VKPQLDVAKRRARLALQGAMRGFLWDLAAGTLESIPLQDDTLAVRLEGDIGIGRFRFTGRLGSRGSVFKAQHPERGTVAVKVLPKANITRVSDLMAINSEICAGRHLPRHPNIVHALGALHTAQDLAIVMEYAGHRSLHALLARHSADGGREPPPVQLVQSFLRQEAAAVLHLHRCWFCYRDLKPSNFVVSDDGQALRLTGTGLGERLCGPRQRLKHCCGSLPFVAPEVLALQRATRAEAAEGCDGLAADVWSLAANFIELGCGLNTVERMLDWTGACPSPAHLRLEELRGLPELWRGCRHKVHDCGLHDLISKMLQLSPASRPTIDHVAGPEGVGALLPRD